METAKYGLLGVSGVVDHTGLGGFITGGGYGYFVGKYGLAIDNLVEVTMVTADGRILKANETENPDLFWGVRGPRNLLRPSLTFVKAEVATLELFTNSSFVFTLIVGMFLEVVFSIRSTNFPNSQRLIPSSWMISNLILHATLPFRLSLLLSMYSLYRRLLN